MPVYFTLAARPARRPHHVAGENRARSSRGLSARTAKSSAPPMSAAASTSGVMKREWTTWAGESATKAPASAPDRVPAIRFPRAKAIAAVAAPARSETIRPARTHRETQSQSVLAGSPQAKPSFVFGPPV